jgi:hypothetical protein
MMKNFGEEIKQKTVWLSGGCAKMHLTGNS